MQAHMSFQKQKLMHLHPGQTAAIHNNGVLVGHVGTLHPELERKLGLKWSHISFRTFIG